MLQIETFEVCFVSPARLLLQTGAGLCWRQRQKVPAPWQGLPGKQLPRTAAKWSSASAQLGAERGLWQQQLWQWLKPAVEVVCGSLAAAGPGSSWRGSA